MKEYEGLDIVLALISMVYLGIILVIVIVSVVIPK